MLTRKIAAVTTGLVLFLVLGTGILILYVHCNSDQIVTQGDRFLVVDNAPRKAEENARWVLRFNPDHHDALLLLGVSLNRQHRYSEAIDVFERAKQTSRFSADAVYARSACLMLEGRYQEAESELNALLHADPDHASGRDMLRKLLEKTFRVHDAAALVQNQFHSRPDDLGYLPECLKISVAFPLGQGVENELSGYNERHPGQPILIAALARAFWLKGRIEESDALFDELLKLDHLKSGQLAWATQFWIETGEFDRATTAIQLMDSVALTEDLEDHHRAQIESVHALFLCSQGEFISAEKHLSRAISLCPNCAEFHSRRAEIRRRLHELDAAMKDAELGKLLAMTSEELRRRSARIELGELTPDICREVSSLYKQQSNDEMAKAWLDLAETLHPIEY